MGHISHTPNRVFIGNQEAAILRHREPCWSSKYNRFCNSLVGCFTERGKASRKILVSSNRLAIFKMDSNDLVAIGFAIRPRTVKCDEGVTSVLGRKLCGIVKNYPKRRGVGFEQYIWNDRLGDQIGTLVTKNGVWVRTDISI